MNEQVLTAKKAVVAELNERLATANAAIVVGYQGLSVKELKKQAQEWKFKRIH